MMIEKLELPENWKWTTLGSVATYINGRGFKKTEWEDSGLPIIRIQNLNKDAAPYNYTRKHFEERYKVRAGDLLFAWAASLGTYIWEGQDAWLNQHIFRIEPKEFCDKTYLYYTLKKIIAELYSKTHGSGMVHVTKGRFEATQIPLPPIEIQHLIVSKIEELFSELNKGIEALKTAQQQLKTYRQAVLKWAFEGRLTNENVKEGELPKGWRVVKMGQVIEKPKYGTSKKCDYKTTGIGVLRIPNIHAGVVDSLDLKFAKFDKEEIKAYNLVAGDILTIRSNGSVDLVGKSALITNKDEGLLYAGYLIRLRSIKTEIDPKYLINVLSSAELRTQIEGKAKSSSGVNNINTEELCSLTFALPSIDEQRIVVQEIESRLSVADKMEESINKRLQEAEALRQSILKRAFEGKLIAEERATLFVPANVYYYNVQTLAHILRASQEVEISHGEMTIAKYTYILNKLFAIPVFYNFERANLGPYAIEMKKAIKNKKFFSKTDRGIEIVNPNKLLTTDYPFRGQVHDAVNELSKIFSKYKGKERSHKTELLATVCKVVEDIQTLDFSEVRKSMKEWKIELKNSRFKNKAEKFDEAETQRCLEFIIGRGWDNLLLKF